MLKNIVAFYLTCNDLKRAIQIKWVEKAMEETGNDYDLELVKIVQPV